MALYNEKARMPNEDTLYIRSKIAEKIISQHVSGFEFTVPEISDLLIFENDDVRRAIKFFESQGLVENTRKKKKSGSSGGPAFVWKIV